MTRLDRALAFSMLGLVSGCDAGKPIYQEAVALEEQSKLTEAAEKYDAVCRRAPDSKMCAPSKLQAERVRLKLAEEKIHAGSYVEARDLLKLIAEGTSDGSARAAQMFTEPELTEGLRWAGANADEKKARALPIIEAVSETKTGATSKAKGGSRVSARSYCSPKRALRAPPRPQRTAYVND